MIDFENLDEFFEGINYEFIIKRPRDFDNSVCWTSLVYEDYLYYDLITNINYTKKNVFYVYLGSLIIKYSGKYILRYLLEKINNSIAEVENNLQNFDLSEEDKEKILSIAKQVKEDLPKLKIFETSTEFIDLERKEFLESQGK